MHRRHSRVACAIGLSLAVSFAGACSSDDQPPVGGGAYDASTDTTAKIDGSGASDASTADTSPSRPDAFGIDTNNALVRFSSVTTPGAITKVAITGLQTNETILAIDVRPSNGLLYALGSTSRLYTLDGTSGAATLVGAVFAATITGQAFGFDFNPVADRARIDGDSGQNMRVDPDTGAVVTTDTALSFVIGDANHGIPPHVTGLAYTPGAVDAGTTSLYALDTALDVLVIQSPPNNGTLNTVGALGVDIADGNGFDIRTESGSDRGYVAATAGGVSNLYRVNLQTGALTLVGAVGGAALQALALTP